MKTLTTTFIFFWLFTSSTGQNIALKSAHLNANDKGLVMYSVRAKAFLDSSRLPIIMKKLQCFENKLIYSSKTVWRKEKYLHFLYAADSKGNVKMVVDRNQNDNFNDDSIYTIPKAFYLDTSTNIYTSSPLIEIDSLHYVDGGIEKKIKIKFRCSPHGLPSIPKNKLAATSSAILGLFPIEIKNANVIICKNEYELRIFKHPLWFVANLDSNNNSIKSFESYSLFKRSKGQRGSLVANGLIYQLTVDSLLIIERCRYKIYSLDHFVNSFTLYPVEIGADLPIKNNTIKYLPKTIISYKVNSKKIESSIFYWKLVSAM
jgi:hypothetical protein